MSVSERSETLLLYPLALEPQQRPAIWGGDALAAHYGKGAVSGTPIGESWECWDGNRVLGGACGGSTLADVRAAYGRRLTGAADPARIFPILTKFIDARQALSVQVHPGDAYALRVEHEPAGKTECWYVLAAEPGASIVLGWQRAMSREEYLTRVRDGSLGDVLRHVPVRPGDTFYLPAGTLHAIGAGIVLFETQQASDLTYRIFDYNRLGPDGRPRELHVEKAADVLNYERGRGTALRTLAYEWAGVSRTALVADANFWLERIALTQRPGELDLEGMPLTLTALGEPVEIAAGGTHLRLEPYATAVIPAELGSVSIRGLAPTASVLAAAPPGAPGAVAGRFARAGVPTGDGAAYLAQFSE